MSTIMIAIDPQLERAIMARFQGAPAKLNKMIFRAVEETARHVRSEVSKAIREEVNIKKKTVDETISIVHAKPNRLFALVQIKKTARIALKEYGARETADGVTYRISKRSKDRGLAPGAFIVDRIGGHVFRRRRGDGPRKQMRRKPASGFVGRLPIKKLFGPSPWGVFLKNDLRKPIAADGNAYLEKRLRARLAAGGEF